MRALDKEAGSGCAESNAGGEKPDLTRPKSGKVRSMHKEERGSIKKPMLTKSRASKVLSEHERP